MSDITPTKSPSALVNRVPTSPSVCRMSGSSVFIVAITEFTDPVAAEACAAAFSAVASTAPKFDSQLATASLRLPKSRYI